MFDLFLMQLNLLWTIIADWRDPVMLGVLVAFVVFGLQWIHRRIKEFHGPFSGVWIQGIYDESEEKIVKLDYMVTKHWRNSVRADIRGIWPNRSQHEWKAEFTVKGYDLVGTYESKDGTRPSYGAWCLRCRDQGGGMDGYYLRFHNNENGLPTRHRICHKRLNKKMAYKTVLGLREKDLIEMLRA